jgi:uncharacterized phage protein (TIGR01671 family)
MNREIKFRIWDKQKKKFVTKIENPCHGEDRGYSTYNNIYIGLGGNLINNDSSNGWGGREIELNAENYIIQQYTGFKDTNGREIYEGDVVNIHYDTNYDIVWRGGGFYCNNAGVQLNSEWFIDGHPQIVGDIFRNSKFLK